MLRLALVVFAIGGWTGVSWAQDATPEGAPEEAEAVVEEEVAEDDGMDADLDELEEDGAIEDLPEDTEATVGEQGFMEDEPVLDVSPEPETPLVALIREVATPSTLGALAAVIFLLILLPLTNALRGQSPRQGVPHLALRLCRFSNEENPELLLELRGRSPGLIGWSLSDNGADTSNQPGVLVTEDQIQFIQRTFSSSTQHSIPIGEIASAHTAYERPFWSLFMACFFSIASAILYSFLGPIAAIGGGLLVVSFSLNFLSGKHVRLTVETRGGVVLSYGFRGNWADIRLAI